MGIVTRKFLIRDPHFRIAGASDIQSTGLSEVNRAEVLPIFGEDIGRNIFFVPLSDRRKQLEAIPWVQQATVMRFLPDHLSVNIVERTPVAFVRQGSRVELADADGVILSMPPAIMAQHHYSFPVVTGINANDPLPARRARMAVYQRFLAELDQNNQHLTQQVSEIDLSDPEDLRATMPEQGSDILAHFGDDHFLQRLQLYKSQIAVWRRVAPKLIGVDLRYSDNVPLEIANDASSKGVTVSGTDDAGAAAAKAASPKSKAMKESPATKPASSKTAAAAHKAAESRKIAKAKAAKAKAVHDKKGKDKTPHAVHANTHAAPQAGQG